MIYRLLLIILCNALIVGSVVAEQKTPIPSSDRLVFGIAPFMSPLALAKRMAPLRKYLSQELEKSVLIETATDAGEFLDRSLNGRYDFLLTNPTFSLMAIDRGDFRIVATQKKKMTGHFVVLAKSNIKNITDLAGKHVGAPPKVGFMGQLIGPYLNSIGYAKNKTPYIRYFHSHNDAISALRLGDTDATLIVSFMKKHLIEKGVPLRTIHQTDDYPGMTVLSKKNMSPEIFNKLQSALYKLDQTDTGKQVLKKISMSGYQSLRIEELEMVRPYLPPQESD